ncbi:hypothetical protein ABW19_dt0200054 [Dactylella cylindrospora]|nr:hypothetical protein ABW19_dt0200054 [Dactylella cylindrospora]
MDYDSPFSPAVISRLQELRETSYLHTALINNYPKPTETHLDTVAAAEAQHVSSVNQNIQTLNDLIRRQEDAIRDLRSQLDALRKREDATPQKIEAAKVIGLKNGSEKAFGELPWIPGEEAGLDTLLALRGVMRVIEESRKGITDTERKLDDMKKVVRREKGWVDNAEEMERELRRKIAELEAAGSLNESQDQRDKRKAAEYEKMRKEMAGTSARLVKDLGKFVKGRLGAMIAVEEAGGPVVGSELDIEALRQYLEVEDVPSRKGKAAKARERGQRRLDELWGDGNEESGSGDPEKKAGEELLSLIEVFAHLNHLVAKYKF